MHLRSCVTHNLVIKAKLTVSVYFFTTLHLFDPPMTCTISMRMEEISLFRLFSSLESYFPFALLCGS